MAQTKESLRQVKDAGAVARKPETETTEKRVKPEPPGFYRGARIKPR